MGRPRHTVLFLGAGASTPFGLPVTAEILPEVLRRLRSGQGERSLREGLETFLPALFDPKIEPPLIVDLLSLMDELLRSGSAPRPGLEPSDLARLRVELEHAVAEVLVEPDEPSDDRGARTVQRLVDWIAACSDSGERFVTLVSTNYDFSMEKRLLARLPAARLPRLVDFGFTWRQATGRSARACSRPSRPWTAIYKLHGSLNWLSCPLCGHVYIHPRHPLFRAGEHGSAPREACTCGHGPLRHVIVTPTMIRDVRNPNLLTLWQSALEALRTADEWVIVGYSMPPEDLAIRSMLLRAYTGREEPPDVTVVQRRAGHDVEARYRLFFPEMKWSSAGLDGFVRRLKMPAAGRKTGRERLPSPSASRRPSGSRRRR
jgi:hypothetical protein